MVTEMIGGDELELLLRRQEVSNRDLDLDRERELNLYRSGSAPPTIEGSLAAMGGVSEEDRLSDPDYLSYYYSQVNLNPRLPPPVLSKEDWRFSQRLQSGLGGIGDKRRSNRAEEQGSSSLFSMQPGFHQQKESEVGAGEWLDMRRDGLIGLTGLAAGRQKSLADMFQDDLGHTTPVSSRPSRPASRNAFSNGIEPLGSGEDMLALHHEIGSLDGLHPGVQNNSASAPHAFASVVGKSLSRSNTPDPQLIGRAPSPSLPPVGVRLGNIDKRNNGSSSVTGLSTGRVDSDDLVTALSGMNLSANGGISKDILFDPRGAQDYIKHHALLKKSDPEQLHMSSLQHLAQSSFPDLTRNTAVRLNGHIGLQKSTLSSPNSYPRSPSSPSITSPAGSPAHYLNMDDAGASFNSYGLNGYSLGSNNLPLFENGSPSIDSRGALGGSPSGSNLPGAHQMPLADPLYIQYLRAAEFASQSTGNFGNPSMERGYMGNSYAELLGIQKAYLGALLQPPKQYGMPFVGKSGDLTNDYYGNPAYGVGMPYPGSPFASHVLPGSPVAPGSPLRHGERAIRYQSGLSNFAGGVMGSWHSDPSGHMGDNFQPSLVEEFKINKAKCYELSDIADHVVEFSADQFGSRFIQQKLETAIPEEKNMVFEEIMPQALMLMTDVFGNYVIQKFFEHGSAAQIRELADKLIGHVLTLSLHMYGCRVIQKAIEVVDLDQQTRMVSELDGHVMKCVHDQNGNHVIQKCIECVPGDAIQFIISSFYDQVVTLSTHPYGCRVIQRVLEHCDDPKIQQIMMAEIMASVCKLAQDQYGNYVVQHLLEHGKPHERSDIIKKLAGQIVQMSQQKFASNVVEKCLLFGGPEERQVLVSEMLGSTEENEPLQAMMKDQFANYVVQKVLETSDEQQREHILSRIKVHLNALKKYTYGKHIVARVEKLVAAGERRIGVQSPYTSLKA